MKRIDILNIEETDEEVEMYDLEVKDNHNFLLENNIITHNSGKTGTALWAGEEAKYEAGHKFIYYVGTPENKEMYPYWFKFIKDIEDIPEGGFSIIDEAGIKYNARKHQETGNKDLTDLMVIARHKSITMIFITQNLSIIDINIDRLLDIMICKPGTDYGLRQKRGQMISKQMREHMIIMNRMKPTRKNECLIIYRSGSYPIYRKITNPLASFWDDEKISKSFRSFKASDYHKKEVTTAKPIINRNTNKSKEKSRILRW